jgi:Putative oxalocrotonate tautomerase enzyme
MIEHVAGRLERSEEQQHFLSIVNDVIPPFVRDKGFDWEFQIDETPIELWSVQGFVPPPAPSAALQRWARENRPTPYGADEIDAKSQSRGQ